jgi:protein-export membrane protein SecD
MRPARATAIVLLAAWATVAASPADARCVAGQAACRGTQLAEARTPLDVINPKTECRRFESRHELHNAGVWDARDIVPTHTRLSRESVEGELQRIGGARLVFQVDTNVLRRELIDRGRDDVRRLLREAKLPLAAATVVRGNAIETRLRETAGVPQALRAIERLTLGPFPQLELQSVGDETQPLVSLTVTKRALAEQLDITKQNTIEYLSRRVQEIGHETSLIQALDGGRILAIIPGLKEPERLWQPMPSRARIDFSIADGAFDPCIGIPVPAESEVVTDETRKMSLLVRRQVIASGQDVAFVAVVRDPQARAPAVVIRFGARASQQLHTATRDNNGRLLAFLVARQVIVAATIREPIENGEIRITGDFTLQQAQDFAMLARAGTLLAPLTVVEREIVAPATVAPR